MSVAGERRAVDDQDRPVGAAVGVADDLAEHVQARHEDVLADGEAEALPRLAGRRVDAVVGAGDARTVFPLESVNVPVTSSASETATSPASAAAERRCCRSAAACRPDARRSTIAGDRPRRAVRERDLLADREPVARPAETVIAVRLDLRAERVGRGASRS